MVLKSEDFFKVLQVLHNVKLCKTCVSIFLNLLGISSMIVDYLVKLIYVSVYIIFRLFFDWLRIFEVLDKRLYILIKNWIQLAKSENIGVRERMLSFR